MFALCCAGVAASVAGFREMSFAGTCERKISLPFHKITGF